MLLVGFHLPSLPEVQSSAVQELQARRMLAALSWLHHGAGSDKASVYLFLQAAQVPVHVVRQLQDPALGGCRRNTQVGIPAWVGTLLACLYAQKPSLKVATWPQRRPCVLSC